MINASKSKRHINRSFVFRQRWKETEADLRDVLYFKSSVDVISVEIFGHKSHLSFAIEFRLIHLFWPIQFAFVLFVKQTVGTKLNQYFASEEKPTTLV